ncbi:MULTISPECIES: DUF4112 domain-containing protein [Sulfitobacter]|jgi:hypothetical protein|uniref:DUF4112 domain-containing protein n=1 Tax=Sulfitobacter TaxID=60136 RepID=UPI0021A40673|nr:MULTISPECIES: DUF4112 domain-containing protein [Sulfitobacter]UWR18001.1 DUF4112 domain-containing protein [Sulfitobacter pontiacus]
MPHTPDVQHDLDRLRGLARTMDSALRVPVLGIRLGWDSILGLIPGVGDVLALAPAGYILKEAHRMGASRSVLARMGANVGIDLAIGAIPLIGDIFDVGWKANIRNVDLLHRHLEQKAPMKTVSPVDGELSSHHPTLKG